MTLDDVGTSLDQATAGFKQMQIVLLVFCGLVTIAIILIVIKLFKG